jgi:CDP-diacylglycerol---glycerol-3-phosphate 3-phosphatidyltransferase
LAVEEFIVLDNANARRSAARFIDPVARLMLRMKVTPDGITWFGCGATIFISVVFLAQGNFLIGAILFGAFGLIDLLDGTMARMLGTAGPWGAFLDSTLDRISDAAVICALIYFYVNADSSNSQLAMIAGIVSLVMSLMTSYARAKAESLDAKCTVGIAERAERNLLIWISLLVSALITDVMPYALAALAVLSTITVIQRILFVRKQLVIKA